MATLATIVHKSGAGSKARVKQIRALVFHGPNQIGIESIRVPKPDYGEAPESATVQFGDSVAVFAQGPIGLCATIGARLKCAGLVIAVESLRHLLTHIFTLDGVTRAYDLFANRKDGVLKVAIRVSLISMFVEEGGT